VNYENALPREFPKSAKGATRTTGTLKELFAPRSVLRDLLSSNEGGN
jgi:hypothetical protein